MSWFLAGAVSVALAVASRPPALDVDSSGRERLVGSVHPSAAAAVAVAAGSHPVAVGFGEFHQTNATARRQIPSTLHRFTTSIFPALAGEKSAPGLSHLLVETWMATGSCGEAERVVTDGVEKTLQRPASTVSEIENLLTTAASAGVRPRILSISCADYEVMRQAQTVDYDRTLRVTAQALQTAALGALRDRHEKIVPAPPGFVAIYGGALHNDVHVVPALAGYSYAAGLMAATLGRYVEIDLVVAEYAAANPLLRAQPWWRAYLQLRRPPWQPGQADALPSPALDRDRDRDRSGAVAMFRRSASSFVIIFPPPPARRN